MRSRLPNHPSNCQLRLLFLALLLGVATILAYRPAWNGGFLWDDDAYITNNELLAAQRHEHLVDRAEIGRDFLDDAAQLLEAPSHLAADLADVAVELEAAAEIHGDGDALGQDRIG